MVRSRKSTPLSKVSASEISQLIQEFERALGDILARVFVFPLTKQERVAVACSGGLDSMVLLHLMQRSIYAESLEIVGLHVHHGLSANADQWREHVRQSCEVLGLSFDHVELSLHGLGNVEERARLGRYQALGQMSRRHQAQVLLTAHHVDDQAETVLLQLLRGSGVAGLAAMHACHHAEDLLGDARLYLARPLLSFTRAQLELIAEHWSIKYVEDESNADTRYARNALRAKVMPQLAELFPGFQQRFERSSRHMQAAQGMLDEIAAEDIKNMSEGDSLAIDKLCALSQARFNNAMRHYLAIHTMRMPSEAWLAELHAQIQTNTSDSEMLVAHPDADLRSYRGRLYLTSKALSQNLAASPVLFVWNGESRIEFPSFGGCLYFEHGDCGISEAWLRGKPLSLHYRRGGERLKLSENRPTRDLKHHYQALAIPPWLRGRLPLVSQDKQLLYVAGLGMHHQTQISDVRPGISLRWES